jgi:hypothetical protein
MRSKREPTDAENRERLSWTFARLPQISIAKMSAVKAAVANSTYMPSGAVMAFSEPGCADRIKWGIVVFVTDGRARTQWPPQPVGR